MSSPRRIVAITALVGILLVGLASSAPDMFTALVDMQRALCDEQTAATLLRQYTANQKQLLQQLDRSSYVVHQSIPHFPLWTFPFGTYSPKLFALLNIMYTCIDVSW